MSTAREQDDGLVRKGRVAVAKIRFTTDAVEKILGFRILERRTVALRGQALPNDRMEKRLAEDSAR